jgi:hypothetical protein
MDDWRRSVEAALVFGVDHVSAYALVIEEGTRMGAQVRRGVLAPTDPDEQAAKYEVADAMLAAAGLGWYEVSNWARPGAQCQHNLGYWRGADWWGLGPGAHSHVAAGDRAVRWWNVKHPRAYAGRRCVVARRRCGVAGRRCLVAGGRRRNRTLRSRDRALGRRVGGSCHVSTSPVPVRRDRCTPGRGRPPGSP